MTAPYSFPAPPAPAKKVRRWPWITALPVAFLFGIGVGGAGETTAPTAASTPSSSYSAPVIAAPAYEPESAPTASVPAGTISNGTYEIGTEVEPGKYKSAGPDPDGVGLCYVDVQRDEKFLAQEVSNAGQVRIEIKESWAGALMEISGCEPLVKQ